MDHSQRKAKIRQDFTARYGHSPTLWAQAPGRVDLMGSHTDYNLGFVLTQAIDRNVWIAARPRADRKIRICSMNVDGCGVFDLDNVQYNETFPWTNYIGGVAAVFQEEGYELGGFDGLIDSSIPIGSGLSSSAALEVSAAVILDTLGDLKMDPVEMALLCQRAENQFVGLNCGILDQYTSTMGVKDTVLLLDCRDITSVNKPLADGVQVVVCDTRAERELTGSEYEERQRQCQEGVDVLNQHHPEVASLRDADLDMLQAHRAEMPPVVYNRCQFVIEENQRVLDIAEAFQQGNREQIADLSRASFTGARDLYEISSQKMNSMMDAMINAPGVIGARQAGAGFGGCMVAFVDEGSTESFSDYVYHTYLQNTGIAPDIYPVQSVQGAGLLNQ
jgi:galactokinase